MRWPALATALAVALTLSCRENEDPELRADGPESHRAYHHTEQLLSFGPRPPQSAGLKKCRDYIAEVLQAHGWQVGTQEFQARTPAGEMTFINVLARYGEGGQELWQQPVEGVIGAHLDSKLMPPPNNFLGADDAASAVGVILSMAEKLPVAERSRLELVFFDGEEGIGPGMGPTAGGLFDGLYGSRAYAERWRRSPTRPQWGLILDMIGHENLRIRLPSDSPPFLAQRLLAAAAAENAGTAIQMGDTPILDDHVPLNEIAGIPAIDMIGDFRTFKWWHNDADNLDIISRESLTLSEAVATRLVRDLLANPPGTEPGESEGAGEND